MVLQTPLLDYALFLTALKPLMENLSQKLLEAHQQMFLHHLQQTLQQTLLKVMKEVQNQQKTT
jgi:hypothetical protein